MNELTPNTALHILKSSSGFELGLIKNIDSSLHTVIFQSQDAYVLFFPGVDKCCLIQPCWNSVQMEIKEMMFRLVKNVC